MISISIGSETIILRVPTVRERTIVGNIIKARAKDVSMFNRKSVRDVPPPPQMKIEIKDEDSCSKLIADGIFIIRDVVLVRL